MLVFLVIFLLPGIPDQPASASQVLGFKVCTTMLGLGLQLFYSGLDFIARTYKKGHVSFYLRNK